MASEEYFTATFLIFIPSSLQYPSTFCLLLILLLAALFSFSLSPGGLAWALSKPRHPIPGPSGLPLLGLLPAFTHPLTHRILSDLSRTFRSPSLMAFSVGLTRFVISSNADTAKEILNSSAFADRPVKESAHALLFHRAMGFAPYGDHWRSLRRVSAAHLFSPRRIAASGKTRAEIGLRMAEQIAAAGSGNRVPVREVLHWAALNNVTTSVLGRGYRRGDDQIEGLVREGYELLGKLNWSDHFPGVGFLDLQGVRRRSEALVRRVRVFVGKIVEEHKMKMREDDDDDDDDGDESGDFVDVLLRMENENRVSDSDIIAVLWEMIFRGTDTVAILLEWILARMILHPDIQAKAHHEIDTVIGSNTPLTHSHLPNLPYLQAIVKETLRLHPPGPLLSWARLAIHDTHVGPHFVPAGTTAMVNMWAITHDDKVWPEPDEFRPERFLEEDVSVMGSDLRLAPFGSGRRVCPGKAMGLATVQLWLGQMLQNFEWSGDSDFGVDLEECLNMSMEMKHPLVCKASPRANLK